MKAKFPVPHEVINAPRREGNIGRALCAAFGSDVHLPDDLVALLDRLDNHSTRAARLAFTDRG